MNLTCERCGRVHGIRPPKERAKPYTTLTPEERALLTRPLTVTPETLAQFRATLAQANV